MQFTFTFDIIATNTEVEITVRRVGDEWHNVAGMATQYDEITGEGHTVSLTPAACDEIVAENWLAALLGFEAAHKVEVGW